MKILNDEKMNKPNPVDWLRILHFDKLKPDHIIQWICKKKCKNIDGCTGATYLGIGHYKALKGAITTCLFKLYSHEFIKAFQDMMTEWTKCMSKLLSKKLRLRVKE